MIENSYRVFGLVAAIFLLFFSILELRKNKVSYSRIVLISIFLIFSFFIGARILYGVLYFQRILDNPWILFQLRLVNFALYGGLIFALIGWYILCKNLKLDGIKITDSLMPYLGISLALSKLGCFFNQCCYGKPTNLPWGVVFKKIDSNPIERLFGNSDFTNMIFGVETVHRHPTQLYEVFFALLASIVAIYLLRKGSKSGLTTITFILIYSIGRLISFFFRDFPSATYISNIIRGPIIYGSIIIICMFVLKRKIRVI